MDKVRQGKQATSDILAEVAKTGRSDRTLRRDKEVAKNNLEGVKAVAAGTKTWNMAVKEAKGTAKRATTNTKSHNASQPIPRTLKGAYHVLRCIYDKASRKTLDVEKTEIGLRKIEKLIAEIRGLLKDTEG